MAVLNHLPNHLLAVLFRTSINPTNQDIRKLDQDEEK